MAELENLEIDDEDEDKDEGEEFHEDDPDDDDAEKETDEEVEVDEQEEAPQLQNIPTISEINVASESHEKAVEENILKPMTTGIFLLKRKVGGGISERRKSGELELPSQETLKMLKRI